MGRGEVSFDEKVALARSVYAAFNRGEFDVVVRHLAADATWQRRPTHPVQGTVEGPAEIADQVLDAIRDQFAELILEPIEFLEHGDQIVVRIRQRAKGRSSGVPVFGELVHVLRERDGLLVELRAFSTLEEALAALQP
jgi:ketosteroid isomerase-like protein